MSDEMPYQPLYCEENIWSLIKWPRFEAVPCGALFISNATKSVAMAGQRGGTHGWVAWDYHVVLLEGGEARQIWDPNAERPGPENALAYLEHSFPRLVPVPPILRPRFRLVSRAEFLADFSTDRRHMRGPDGHWLAPPPPWRPPGPGHTLSAFMDVQNPGPGDLMDLPSLRAHPWCTRN